MSVALFHHQGLNAMRTIAGWKENLLMQPQSISLIYQAIHAVDVLIIEAQGGQNVGSGFHLVQRR